MLKEKVSEIFFQLHVSKASKGPLVQEFNCLRRSFRRLLKVNVHVAKLAGDEQTREIHYSFTTEFKRKLA